MGEKIEDSRLVIITAPKLIHLHLSKNADNSMKYGTEFVLKHNELSTEITIKRKISQSLSKYKHQNNIKKKNRKRSSE